MSNDKRKKVNVSTELDFKALRRLGRQGALKKIATEYDVGSATAGDGKPNRDKIEKCLPELQMKVLIEERDR